MSQQAWDVTAGIGGHSGGRSGGHIKEAEEAAKPAHKRKRSVLVCAQSKQPTENRF